MDKFTIISSILEEYSAELGFELNGYRHIYPDFVKALTNENYTLKSIKGIRSTTLTKIISFIFPDRDPLKQKSVDKYILSLKYLRECKDCSTIKHIAEFRPNAGRSCGYNAYCKSCQQSRTKETQPKRQAQYKAASLQRIVPWTDMEEISAFYAGCPSGYHVDHVVPLQGELVSGLHVIDNLQYLSAEENLRKHNKFIAG